MNNEESMIDEEMTEEEMADEEETEEKLKQFRPQICYDILGWLSETSFCDFFSAISERVVGQRGLEKLLYYVYMYLRTAAKWKRNKAINVLVAAPSGTGKTETYRALHDYFAEKLPRLGVIMFDTSSLTEAGYKGADVKNILMPLAKNHAAEKGIGLVFLDEIDKKLQPSSDGRNFNAAAQSNLLTMLEGQKFDPDEEYDEKEMIDTSNTMFIGCGAFDFCRDDKKKAVLGFSTSKAGNHYDEITLEDIVSHGGMHQLVGRFTSIINYNALSPEAIDKIIDLLLKKASEDNNCQLYITEGMRAYLHNNANTEYGCRRLDSIIRDRAADLITAILMKQQPLPKSVLLDSPEKKEKVMEQE